MSRIAGFVWMGTGLLLSGCAVGPNFTTPDAPGVPTFQRSSSAPGGGDAVPGRVMLRGADIPAQWWELFRSQSLNVVVREGLTRNADLAAAHAAVRVAQANARAQRGSLFPVIGAGFDASRHQIPTGTLNSDVVTEASRYSLHTGQVTVSFVPDVWGGSRRQIESVDAQAEMQAFQREGVSLTLASNIALAAIEEARLRGQLSAVRDIVGLQTQLLNSLKRQNEQGQIAMPDVVAQEAAVAQARLLVPQIEKQLRQQENLIAFLTGRLPSEPALGSFRLNSFVLPRRLPLSLPADLVRQRPDIRAAEANLRAANAQVGVAIANRLPQITLTANPGSTSTAIGQLFTPGTGFWTIAGSLAQTVFDAGTLENRQRAAEEATVQAAEQYRSTVLAAFQNVADVLGALQADARAITAAATAEKSARQYLDLMRRQLDQGQVNVAVLLTSQQAVLQSSLARVDAEAARLADTVALFQALGGGWWNAQNDNGLTGGVSGRPVSNPSATGRSGKAI